jgi:anaerobic ribonucleoside-triphosphate reductase activating protein
MRLAGVLQESLQDGKGCNLVVFTQGCSIRCPGCHNPETWDASGGYEASIDDILNKVTECTTGLTISGGEPTDQAFEVLQLIRAAKKMGLRTTMYTGLTSEQLVDKHYTEILIDELDYIKVGPYVDALRCTSKGMTGSTNQTMYKISHLGGAVWLDCEEVD